MVTIQQPPFDLAALRDEFLPTHRGMTYLNHAGMSPLPLRAARAMEHAARLMAEQGSGIYQDFNPGIKRSLRARLAELVNARPDEIAFVESTSMGINLLANSLPIHAGDNVIVCDVEFPSNVYPWQNLTGKGIEARLVPAVEGGLSLEQVEAVRDGRTQAVAVSAVQFFTGRMEDLAAIGAYCRAHDLWLVVDAIQAAGVVELDMRAMNIHVLAAGGQKALMGPPGQGFMAIREDLLAELSPAFVGPVSVVDYERWLDYDLTPLPGAARFEMGTANTAGLAGLNESVGLLLELGVANIQRWVTELAALAIRELQSRGLTVITPHRHAHIVTFEWDGDPVQVRDSLAEAGIILREHYDGEDTPHLRISLHAYNTVEDVHTFIEALEAHR